jgi:hypothetical protein
VITLGQRDTDNIKQMISKYDESDKNKRVITLTVMTLSGAKCLLKFEGNSVVKK